MSLQKSMETKKKLKITAIAIFTYIVLVWHLYSLPLEFKELPPNQIGDAYGSLNTLFSGLAFAAFIITLYFQYAMLKNQEEELKNVTRSMQNQNLILQMRQFEKIFFSMISLLPTIEENIKIEFKGIHGRACFKAYYDEVKFQIDVSELSLKNHLLAYYLDKQKRINIKNETSKRLCSIRSIYEKIYNYNPFDDYFSFLYNIIKHINKFDLLNIQNTKQELHDGIF